MRFYPTALEVPRPPPRTYGKFIGHAVVRSVNSVHWRISTTDQCLNNPWWKWLSWDGGTLPCAGDVCQLIVESGVIRAEPL